MKVSVKLLSIVLSFSALVVVTNGCKKADRISEQQQGRQTTTRSVIYSPANTKVQAGYEDANGQLISFAKGIGANKTAGDYPGCGDRAYLIDMAYNGFTAIREGDGSYSVYYTWTLGVPEGEIEPAISSFNKGYLRFSFPVSTWRNAPATFTYKDTYQIDEGGVTVNMKRYEVTYSFSLDATDYCGNLGFHTYFKLGSDCSEFPFIQMVGTPSYIVDDFEPDTYIVYEYGASNNTSAGYNFDLYPLIPTPPPCHEPSLGNSPTHEIRYSKQGVTPTPAWETMTSTNSASVTTPNLSSAGVYEYQSRGLLNSPSNWSPWTPIKTVTVN